MAVLPFIEVAFVLLVLLLASFDPAWAQSEYSSEVDVRVVNLDVVVNDQRGRPVDDLTRDDFTLLVDGQPETITNFSVIETAALLSRDSAEQASAFLLFYFDNTNIDSPQRNAFIEDLRAFLLTITGSPWQVMVTRTDATGLQLHGGFTSEWERIDSALGEVEGSAAQDLRSPAVQEAMQELRRLAGMASSAFTSRSSEAQLQVVLSRVREISQEAREEMLRTGAEIWRVVDAMAGWPGWKAIVYVGGGVA